MNPSLQSVFDFLKTATEKACSGPGVKRAIGHHIRALGHIIRAPDSNTGGVADRLCTVSMWTAYSCPDHERNDLMKGMILLQNRIFLLTSKRV